MKTGKSLKNKVLTLPELLRTLVQWRLKSSTIVFTNGCFDILHAGHISSLTTAAEQGDYLVVGVNGDVSIKGLKGPGRPVNDEQSRALVLASLAMVDAVVIFNDPTPLNLIISINPDVLVKGGDYNMDNIAGAKEVINAGGRIFINPIIPGFSTSSIINQIQNKRTIGI